MSIIEEILSAHIKEIKENLKINNWDVDNLEIMFTGGSLLLQQYLSYHFSNFILSQDPIWDNTLGLQKVGELIWAK